jgi:hypothetical protein
MLPHEKLKMWRLFNMRKNNYLNFLIIIILSLSVPFSILAENKDGDGKHKRQSLQKTTDNPVQSIVDINNITSWVGSDGYHDWLVGGSWNGAYPNGVNAGAIFSEGIVWGGKVNDGTSPQVRVNGNTYGSGCKAITRLFRVRPDYASGNLTQDAADFLNIAVGAVTESDIAALRAQYETDWNEWPAKGNPNSAYGDQGAPFKDVDGNGLYDPTIDVPGIPAASQTLFIKYNDDQVPLYGAPAIGLEVTEVYWAYAYTGALGNVIYKKVNIVYKGTPTSASNSNIQDMYIVQWADPDVGNSTDDFAGCDTTLNLGYAYSSRDPDAVYEGLGLAPPAVGYDFLQGVSKFTGNPNDSAIVNLEWRHGYKYVNLKPDGTPIPMSSFVYFAAGGTWSDPAFTYTGSLEFYNLMRGFKPDPPYPAGEPFPSSVADVVNYGTFTGTFLLTGDPVAGTGKLDGNVDGPGDRRIMVTNGPISMNLGDTAEVVIALVGGLGTDHLNSVAQMKTNDETAQTVFDLLFKLPSLSPPNVQIAEMDKKIVLNWGWDLNSINEIETFSDQGYSFEGYEVYQLPSASSTIENGVLLGVFDLVDGITAIYDTTKDANGTNIPVLVVDGKDAGIQRYLTITTDKIKNVDLRNGQEYYFAVVPYAFNPFPLLPFHALRAPVVIHIAIPQQPVGYVFNSEVGDTLTVTHTGPSDGSAVAIVVDPTVVTGHTYNIVFDTSGGATSWGVKDVTTNTTKVSGLTNQSGDQNYPIIDGILVKVIGPPEGVKPGDDGWTIPTGTRRFTWSNADFGFESFNGALGWASPYEIYGGGPPGVPATDLDNVLLKLATVTDAEVLFDPTFDPNDANMSYAYRYGRNFANPPADPRFAPHIINAVSGYSFQDFTKNMPMSAWNVEDPANPERIVLGWLENNVADGLVDGKYWPSDASLDNVGSSGPREWLFIYKVPYSETEDATLEVGLTANPVPIMYWATWNRRGPAPFSPNGTGTDQFEIFHTNINYVTDVFSYMAPTFEKSDALAKEDVNKINVFPNPYYGYQYREISRDQHYVTFSHLPDQATLRIFDLSGVLIKTIDHVASSGQFDYWNLQNESGYPVASGIYVVYVDMPALGTTKILKLAVIQEQQILKVY